jgi:hypothetical protein
MNFTELYSDAPLTKNELTSITALVEYVAFTRGSHTENTYCHLAAEFRVNAVNEIRRRDFERAVQFLVDLPELKAN